MQRYLFFCLLAVSLLYAQTGLDLYTQYNNAYRLSWEWDEVRYQAQPPEIWAIAYMEKHLTLPSYHTLYQNYIKLLEFARVEPLRYDDTTAEIWAKAMLLRHYRYIHNRSLAEEFGEFLKNTVWLPEQKKWFMDFLQSTTPLYCRNDPLRMSRELTDFFKNHKEFAYKIEKIEPPSIEISEQEEPTKQEPLPKESEEPLKIDEQKQLSKGTQQEFLNSIEIIYDPEKAKQIIQTFIRNRYYFDETMDLATQYRTAYQYALDWQYGLGLERTAGEIWAKNFVRNRASLNSQDNIARQYNAILEFAEYELRIEPYDRVEAFAIDFLRQKLQIPHYQDITIQLREAYLFAYTSDFLPILRQPENNLGSFLHNQAIHWAKEIIELRSKPQPSQDFTVQYHTAVNLAYQNFYSPTQSEERITLEEARDWAKKWMTREE